MASWSDRDNGMPSFLLLGEHRFGSTAFASLLALLVALTLFSVSSDPSQAFAKSEQTVLAKASPADYQIAAKIKTHRAGQRQKSKIKTHRTSRGKSSKKSNIRTHRAGVGSDQSKIPIYDRSKSRRTGNIRVRRVGERSGSSIRVHRQ